MRSKQGPHSPRRASHPELKTLNRLHFPVIRAVEIGLRGRDMGMPHQRLNRLEIVSLIEEGCGKSMPQHVRVDPLLDQRSFYHGSDKAVNRFFGENVLKMFSGERIDRHAGLRLR